MVWDNSSIQLLRLICRIKTRRGDRWTMASFIRISVLVRADILTGYAIWVMMTYLANVWKLNFTHAAAIDNVFLGAATIMPTGMAFIVDAFVGDYFMLLLSSLAYSFVSFLVFPGSSDFLYQ